MTLKLLEDAQSEPRFANTLLYGPGKSGKSTAACSIPGGILYLATDTPNAMHYAFERHNQDGRIKRVDLSNPMEALIDVAHMVQSTPPSNERIFDTVVVDPVGELYRRLLEEASNRAVRPTLSQYGDVGTHLERFCRMLCEAPVHSVFVCHDHPVRDESTGEIERLPKTSTSNPALSEKLIGMVDIVGYTGVVQTEDQGKQFVAQLVSAKGRRGGDRFDVLGDIHQLDLAEWLTLAGCYVPATDTSAQEAQKEKTAA